MTVVKAFPLLLLCWSTLTSAAPTSNNSPTAEERIKATLEQRLQGYRIESVRPSSAFPGMYDVVTPTELAYTDSQASMLFVGQILDTRTREDLSAKRWSELHPVDFTKLPLGQAIKTVRGDGSRVVAVFADPHCPYCQKFEHDTQGVTNITIYTFLFPLENVHPGATARAHAIWCAPDPANAWSEWMTRHIQPPAPTCESDPLQALHTLGNQLDVNMTPTLFFTDGHRVAGGLSEKELEQHLQHGVMQAKTESASAKR